MQTVTTQDRPGLWRLLATWFLISIQSFGGGTSTFYLIHEAFVARGWLSEDEFVQTWALVQIAPGINLVKMTVLIGHKLCGWSGVVVSMLGLLLPSATITVLMTAGFAAVRGHPLVQAALRGVLPATVGLSLAMTIQMAQPVLGDARRKGRVKLAAYVTVVAAAALLLAFGGVSPVTVLFLAGVVTLLLAAIPGLAEPKREEGLP